MKTNRPYNRIVPTPLPWWQEVGAWAGAIILLPLTIPLMILFIMSAIALAIYSKWNKGLDN